MDIYGCLTVSKEDAHLVKSKLRRLEPALFPLGFNNFGCLIVLITPNFQILGKMPFGGNPAGRIYVSIFDKGAFHFPCNKVHADYFAEKLNLDEGTAKHLADFWEMLWEED